MQIDLFSTSNTELKATREFLGLSLNDCAKYIADVKVNTWCKWERNYYIPDDVLEKMKNLVMLRFELYQIYKQYDLSNLLDKKQALNFDEKNDPIHLKITISILNELIVHKISHAKR